VVYERNFRGSDLPEDRLNALSNATLLCAWSRRPPPKWIVDAVAELCDERINADRRPGRLGSYRARSRQHAIHLIRWATVRHLRDNCRKRVRTWNDAYTEASRELRGTIAQGSAEAMAASYKIRNRNSFQLTRKTGGRGTLISLAARQYFEARNIILGLDGES
jgi:hypothetical protein